MVETRRPPALPRATVRLQLHKAFGFDAVTALVPYLAALGVSHVYTSPFLMARPGSTHGYDITDHNRLNPEIGDAAALERLTESLHAHGMGLILDFVPNHMGIGTDNPWWLDVLEWGEASPFARFFDIDWSPADPTLNGKVLLPVLGDHYGTTLEKGEIQLRFDADRGAFNAWYYDNRFPIAIRTYPELLREARRRAGDGTELTALIDEFERLPADDGSIRQKAMVHQRTEALKGRLAALAATPAIRQAIEEAAAAVNGTPGDPASFQPLHAILEAQAYRLAFWRVATAEINYRRFFDINELAGLRMEESDLFEVAHQLVFRLIAEGKLQGLRLDHVDGLFDPAGYCRQLQDRAAYLLLQAPATPDDAGAAPLTTRPREHPLYLLVEKILAHHERLRGDWPVDGTTGYEFMNLINGLFVDPRAERALDLLYRRFTGRAVPFDEIALAAKRQIVTTSLASELTVLTSDLHSLARQSWTTRDYTFSGIRNALIGMIVQFPVYRTYITAAGPSEEDRRDLDWATAKARKASTEADTSVFDFLHAVLSTDLRQDAASRGYDPDEILRVAMKFQQITGPAMAKAIEDTAFYRYFRLVSLNEVGGEPNHFGVSPAAFHHLNRERLKNYPFALLATATHDHKRGEDTRLRIDAITELTAAWVRGVRRWSALNRFHKREVDGVPAPDANDEYLIYQTVLGMWPLDWDALAKDGHRELADRLAAYVVKAIREAKAHTSWTQPNADYEAAAEGFARAILDPDRAGAFLTDLRPLAERAAVVAACHGLAQTLLKVTVPGVPDVYQGTEFWDLSLVDPDNRRPVDYEARQASLQALGTADPTALLADWRDGRIKQFVLARTLALRQGRPALFADGTYQPMEATGRHADRVVAFQRRLGDDILVVVAPRLAAPLVADDNPSIPPEAWQDTSVAPADLPDGIVLRDQFTGRTISPASAIRLSDILGPLPVACLVSTGA